MSRGTALVVDDDRRLSGTHFEPRIVDCSIQALPEVLSIMRRMEDRSVGRGCE